MNEEKDPLDKNLDQLQAFHQNQIVEFYRGNGQYYTAITREMSAVIFNWAFTLNTGGLAASITSLATFKSKSLCLVVISMVCFVLGIVLIVFAAFLEHHRFSKKGKKLDESFKALDNHIICISHDLI